MKKMNSIKILRILSVLVFLSFFVAIFIGKKSIFHLYYHELIQTATYDYEDRAFLIRSFPSLENILIDDSAIRSIDNLIDDSDYVFQVKVTEEPFIFGISMVDTVEILGILKDSGKVKHNVGESIYIYQYTPMWRDFFIVYIGGMVPLNEKYEYIVFLKEAPSQGIPNSYVYSSVKYGYFNISNKEANILWKYQGDSSLKVIDVLDYDYVQPDCLSYSSHLQYCDDNMERYMNIRNQLLEYLEKEK